MRRDPDPIPFNSPMIADGTLEYIRQTVEAMHTSGDGPFSQRCVEILRESIGVSRVLLTPSCTSALEMSALLLGIEPGDEVIVPSFTFSSTVNAFVLRGARPVFADVRPDTLNIDEHQIEPLIGPRTRAIVVVHYAGVGCEMDAIGEVAARHGIPIVEDNAHGLFGTYRGRQLGTFGPLAALSFHETKNFSCGEGGALLVNDDSYFERAEIIRDKGTDRQQLFRGAVDKYTWVDVGSSFVLSDILAAVLYAQLRARDSILERRRKIWDTYDREFRGELEDWGVQLPTVPEHCGQAYHMYFLILPSLEYRRGLIQHLAERGIDSVFHYQPLHLSKMGSRLAPGGGACPVAERAGDCLLRLPFFNDLGSGDQARVIEEVRAYGRNAARRATG